MRRPTFLTAAERWAWWEAAMAGRRPPMVDDEPQSGFFAVRRWSGGPFAPARVLWEPADIDAATGELAADEICRTDIDGFGVDPWESWTWIAKHPVSLETWDWLRAISTLSRRRSPKGYRPWWEIGPRPPI